MRAKFRGLKRSIYAAVAFALTVAIVSPGLVQKASAQQVMGNRSIEISSSLVSATGVDYLVTFNTSASIGASDESLVVDFCQDSPIIGATCSTANGVTFTGATITNSNLPTGFALDTATGSTVKVKGTTNPLLASTSYHFTITGVNNPTGTAASAGTAGSFYARLTTYNSTAYNGYTSAAAPGTYDDYGGFALSTTSQISITATVQEQLQFCVSAATIAADCGSLSTPSLTLGNGGTPNVLDTTQEDVSPAYTQLTTNASAGAAVTMKATNLCTNGGLTVSAPGAAGGCTDMPGIGATATTFTAGTANFGMCVAPGTGVTASAPYVDSVNGCPTTYTSGTKYGMDGNGTTGTTSTYGQEIYNTGGGPISNANSSLTFAAEASLTTPPGIYEGGEILIATGTF